MFTFFFNDTATTEIYTLSLHDALPISGEPAADHQIVVLPGTRDVGVLTLAERRTLDLAALLGHSRQQRSHARLRGIPRSEEHTSELQSTPISRMPSSA